MIERGSEASATRQAQLRELRPSSVYCARRPMPERDLMVIDD